MIVWQLLYGLLFGFIVFYAFWMVSHMDGPANRKTVKIPVRTSKSSRRNIRLPEEYEDANENNFTINNLDWVVLAMMVLLVLSIAVANL
jgi:hypothetical protein